MDSRWPRRGKFCWARFWIVAFIPSRISLHLVAALTVRWWSWSSIGPPLFISRFSSFHGWNAERCAGLFWWFWMRGLNYRQFIIPVSLWNFLFWYSQFWWNDVQYKHNIGPVGGRKTHPPYFAAFFQLMFGQQSYSPVLRNICLTVKEFTNFSVLTMKSRKELEIHMGHIPSS